MQSAAPVRPHVWQRWEHALTGARKYANPYADVTLRVSYTGPDGRTLRTHGFWDGAATFRIRCAFPVPGIWRWETACSDATDRGLHGQHGAVEVLPYRGDRPLYRRGFLKVSDNRRYTYGAGDVPPKCPQGSGAVWRWVTDPEKHDYWKKSLQWESGFQMQYLHDFLAAIEWWRLEPAHELIRNQPDDITRRMVLAKAAGRDLAVAYLPDNNAVEVDLSAFSGALAARWFDPVRGRCTAQPGRVENAGVRRFTPPAKGDWVLLLERHRQ